MLMIAQGSGEAHDQGAMSERRHPLHEIWIERCLRRRRSGGQPLLEHGLFLDRPGQRKHVPGVESSHWWDLLASLENYPEGQVGTWPLGRGLSMGQHTSVLAYLEYD